MIMEKDLIKGIKRLKWLWKCLKDRHRYDIPILVKPIKAVWVWYDPDSKSWGWASSLTKLKKTLREKYFCPQCQSWHVLSVVIDYGGTIEIRDFYPWVRTWESLRT